MPIFQVLVLVLILLLWFIACLAYAQTDSNSTGETIFAVICFGILAGAILFLLCLAGTFTHIIGWPTP